MLTLLQDVESDLTAAQDLKKLAAWVRRYLCVPNQYQGVVDNRALSTGGFVTLAQFQARDRAAHVCPFMDEAVKQTAVWLDERYETTTSEIERLMLTMPDRFKMTNPVYDPLLQGRPAAPPALNKAFVFAFPRIRHLHGSCPEVQSVQQALKPLFVQHGMMIGDFFSGHPQQGLYSPTFYPLGKTPFPLLAVRYLVEDDKLFNQADPKVWIHHQVYFP